MVYLLVLPVLSSLAFFPPKRRGVSPSFESPADFGGKKPTTSLPPGGSPLGFLFLGKKPAAYGCRPSRGMTARFRAGGSRERQTGATSALAHRGNLRNSAGVFGEVTVVLAIEFFTAPGLDPGTAAKTVVSFQNCPDFAATMRTAREQFSRGVRRVVVKG